MCCQNFWKKVLAFSVAFLLSISITALFQSQKQLNTSVKREFISRNKVVENQNSVIRNSIGCKSEDYSEGNGIGSGSSYAAETNKTSKIVSTKRVKILFKPRPSYTDAARQNQTAGIVRLRVTFLASGQLGRVLPVRCLSDGLTEQAIEAAKRIRFEPAEVNGVAQTVTKQIEYSFSIY